LEIFKIQIIKIEGELKSKMPPTNSESAINCMSMDLLIKKRDKLASLVIKKKIHLIHLLLSKT